MALTETPAERRINGSEGGITSLVQALIACTDEGQGLRLKTQFYDRFKEKFYDRLKKVSSKLYSGIPDCEGRTDEVFNETFLIVFDQIKEFKMGDGWGDVECEKVMLNWMSKIANNCLLKVTRSVKKEKRTLQDYKDVQRYDLVSKAEHERSVVRPTYDKAKFDHFWASLNPMSREILMASIKYGTIKVESGTYVSHEEIDRLTQKNNLYGSAVPKELKTVGDGDDYRERNTDHLPDEVLTFQHSGIRSLEFT